MRYQEGDLGPRVGPCDDPHARLLESDRMQFTASDAFYSGERRLEELERTGIDAEVVSPMPPLLDFGLPARRAWSCRGGSTTSSRS